MTSFDLKGYIYYPESIREMVKVAMKAETQKATINRYYKLLEAGEEKNKVYAMIIEIVYVVDETKKTIRSHESDYLGKYKKSFMLYMKDSERHKELEFLERSIKSTCNRIQEMYNRAKERV